MEDYKQKYKEAFERAKVINPGTADYEVAVKIFPELKEIEDERVKNEIIAFVEQSIHRGGGTPIPQEQENRWLAWLEKQGERKHICQLDNSYTCVKFPFKAKVKSNGKIITIHDGQLSPDGKEWIKYQSDAEDRYKIYEPDNLELVYEIERNNAWSEEDELNFNQAIYVCHQHGYLGVETWLKSLKQRMKGE